MQARYYDPVIGRFYSNDPIGFRDIHSFNRYAYVNNNPYKYTDPTGMHAVDGACGIWLCFDEGKNKEKDENGLEYKIVGETVGDTIHHVKKWECATIECVMHQANVPEKGNEGYHKALKEKSKGDLSNAAGTIGLAATGAGLVIRAGVFATRLTIAGILSSSASVAIDQNEVAVSNLLLTVALPQLEKINEAVTRSITFYYFLFTAGEKAGKSQ